MIDVKQWLESGADPIQGLKLLEKYGVTSVLLRIYQSAPDKYRDNIKATLKKLSYGSVTENAPPQKKKSNPSSFRQQYPFLNDADCPLELKALVTDKFSSFYKYKDLHTQLTDFITLEECASKSKELLLNFIENRQIYSELDYYKNYKTVLGKHPIFKQFENIQALRKLSIKELVLKQQLLEHNVWRIESEIKKGDKPHLEVSRKASISVKQAELAEVKRLLGE